MLQPVKQEQSVKSGTENYFVNQIAVSVINCVLVVTIVGLNGVSILTIVKTPVLKQKVCYFLILVQSCVDLTVGVIGLPLHIYFLISELLSVASCFINFLAIQITLCMNGLSLVVLSAITLERYYGILHPLLHRTKMTKRKIRIYIIFVSLFMFFSIVLWFTYSTLFAVVTYAALVLLLLFTTFAYARIFVVGRQKLGHSRNRLAVAEQNQAGLGLNEKRSFLRELKLAKSCFLVLICYVVCFIPGPMVYLIAPENDTPGIRRIKRSWIMSLFALNSSLNSLIFFWAKPMLRNEAKKVLKKLWHKNANN